MTRRPLSCQMTRRPQSCQMTRRPLLRLVTRRPLLRLVARCPLLRLPDVPPSGPRMPSLMRLRPVPSLMCLCPVPSLMYQSLIFRQLPDPGGGTFCPFRTVWSVLRPLLEGGYCQEWTRQ
ncbi:unnamed protein product [Staurois parvus]|uniref:Uncharacterized protein n=1 Tax=Staurois parvus TaxID=386267 RepID=A0ABN9HAH8_9NEOB|nr:unnamed protein product [Staurois parvus]